MITLPTRTKESRDLGLPLHLARKERAHKNYSRMVAEQLNGKIPPVYQPLADEVNAKKHKSKCKRVNFGNVLIPISKATYAAIMSIAKAQRAAKKTLNQVAADIAKEIAALAQQAPK